MKRIRRIKQPRDSYMALFNEDQYQIPDKWFSAGNFLYVKWKSPDRFECILRTTHDPRAEVDTTLAKRFFSHDGSKWLYESPFHFEKTDFTTDECTVYSMTEEEYMLFLLKHNLHEGMENPSE